MSFDQPPPRTGLTSLTDDELLVFDAIFDCRWPFHMLSGVQTSAGVPNYVLHNNVRWCHHLSDEDLGARLQLLEDQGLVTRTYEDGSWRAVGTDWVVGLTSAGAALWEQERRPDWSRYVVDISGTDRESDTEVSSFGVEALLDYLASAHAVRRLPFDRSTVPIEVIGGSELIYWRVGQAAWRAHLRVRDLTMAELLAHGRANGRTWSRVSELIRLP